MTNFQLEFAHQLFVLPIERLEERRGACVRCHRRLEICAGSFNPCLETDGDNQQLPPVRRRGVPASLRKPPGGDDSKACRYGTSRSG